MFLKNIAFKTGTLLATVSLCAESSAEKITSSINDILIAEKKIASEYQNLSPEDRPVIDEKIRRAGISVEALKPREEAKPLQPKPIRPLIIPKKPSSEEKAPNNAGIINQEELEKVRASLKPTPARETLAAPHLPGKPTPDELQEGIHNLRKTKDITLEMNS